MKDEQLYSIALTRIPGLGLIGIHKLVDALGSATAVFRNRKDLCELVPGISPKQINANYQHYLEHTRHEFLTSVGISFAKLHEEGVDPVVARLTMAFKTPLKSGDEFVSKLYLKKEGIKYVFYQDIFRLPDMKVAIKATVESVCVVNGRLGDSALFDETFAPYLNKQ